MNEANKEILTWLSEYSNHITKRNMRLRIKDFLNGINMNAEDFMKLSAKDARHIILEYQARMKEKGVPNNTILSNLCAPRAFFKFLDKPILLKGKMLEAKQATQRHDFSNGDLGKMFEVADIRGKALIATASSLGWAISDVKALDREFVKTQIKRAQENNETFVFFKANRQKTNVTTLGVLNPLAVEWLQKWFNISKGAKVFNLSNDQINRDLQTYAKEAQITETGHVSFHAFRSWVFSSLIKSGFDEFSAKLIVGKKIPLSDSTYLRLEESIKTKYAEVYDKYLNICATTQNGQSKTEAILQLEKENKEHKATIEALQTRITELQSNLTKVSGNVDFLLKEYSDRTGNLPKTDLAR